MGLIFTKVSLYIFYRHICSHMSVYIYMCAKHEHIMHECVRQCVPPCVCIALHLYVYACIQWCMNVHMAQMHGYP